VKERLQKILAKAGYGSRRGSEALIVAGRVRVNGVTLTQLGTQADPARDRIEVDGRAIDIGREHAHLAMNKPAGAVTTMTDPRGRRTVADLLPAGLPSHVFPVGRLDMDTEGLLLFTNDGEFAHRLAHPSFTIDKEYLALVRGAPTSVELAKLQRGVAIAGKRTSSAEVAVARAPHGHAARDGATWLTLTIHEGRKRQVRLMCAAAGLPVITLVRTRIGPVRLGRLGRGETRRLAASEVAALRSAVGLG
jgi:pseudouridine synthase